jgi:hypothetical protein
MIVTLDPTTEDASNVQLVISDTSANYLLTGLEIPDPELKSIMASSFFTEGEIPAHEHAYQNRTVTVMCDVTDTTHTLMETRVRALTQKLAKFNREPAQTTPGPSTLKVQFESGNSYVFDVVSASGGGGPEITTKMTAGRVASMSLTFVCRPFARGANQVYGAVTESDEPVLRLNTSSTPVKGDVPGLGRLLVDEMQAVDQFWLQWGIRSRYYSTDADNAILYEAEGRTVLGGATVVTGTAPTSPTGTATNNVVRQATLTPTWQAMLSTQATGGGNHLEHIGDYRVWARVFRPTTNTGETGIRLDWSEGDFMRFTSNDPVLFDNNQLEGQWVIVDLGLVHLRKVVQGTQRWIGRFVAKSSATGDDLDIDCFWLQPITEGGGEVVGSVQVETPTTFSARDEFTSGGGSPLNAKVMSTGGSWATSGGDADDFDVLAGADVARRLAVSDGAFIGTSQIARLALGGVTTYTNIVVQVDMSTNLTSTSSIGSVVARYVDTNNFVYMTILHGAPSVQQVLTLRKRVAGAEEEPVTVFLPALATDAMRRYQLMVLANGRLHLWAFDPNGLPGVPLASWYDPVFATGGALATGRIGFGDTYTSAAWVPTPDAALFASQSAEIRHDRYLREDSAGTVWVPRTIDGFHLRVPPGGQEGRVSEIMVKASRTDPLWGPDPAIDDIRGTLTVTPQYISVPEA